MKSKTQLRGRAVELSPLRAATCPPCNAASPAPSSPAAGHGSAHRSPRTRKPQLLPKPTTAFLGKPKADTGLTPPASILPDAANWRVPEQVRRAVIDRLDGRACLQTSHTQRFTSPFINPTLKQPPALRCPPMPRRATPVASVPQFRADTALKPALLAAQLEALPGLHRNPPLGGPKNAISSFPRFPTSHEASNEAAARLLANWGRTKAPPRLPDSREAAGEDVIADEGLGGGDAAFADDASDASSTEATMDRSVAAQRRALETFDSSVREKKAFHKFLQRGVPSSVPAMVLKAFRHQLALASPLIDRLRGVPLVDVEKAVAAVGSGCLTREPFIAWLEQLLGDNRFTHFDALNLLRFADVDNDGDLDRRELSCAMVQVLSADGPLVSVLHRAQVLAAPPPQRDGPAQYVRRYELELIAEAVEHGARPALEARAVAAQVPTKKTRRRLSASQPAEAPPTDPAAPLRRELAAMVATFGNNRRGELTVEDARSFIRASPIIMDALSTFTVPRESRLFKSPLSRYYNSPDAQHDDTGELPFKLLTAEKVLLQATEAEAAARGAESVQRRDSSSISESEEDLLSGRDPLAISALASRALSDASSAVGVTQASAPAALRPTSGRSVDSQEKPDRVPPEDQPRATPEPGNPTFFSRNGTVFRVDDENQTPVAVTSS